VIEVNPNADSPGAGEKDNLSGTNNRDLFILGDARTAYYKEGSDQGTISQFNPSEDKIQLHGSPDDYTLRNNTHAHIFYKDELIGVILNQPASGLSLNSDIFSYASGTEPAPAPVPTPTPTPEPTPTPTPAPDGNIQYREVIDVINQKIHPIRTTTITEILRLGFSPVFFPYVRPFGNNNKSRWSFKKKYSLAKDFFFSSSTFPIKLITYIGVFFPTVESSAARYGLPKVTAVQFALVASVLPVQVSASGDVAANLVGPDVASPPMVAPPVSHTAKNNPLPYVSFFQFIIVEPSCVGICPGYQSTASKL
jgi:hypothetical protein